MLFFWEKHPAGLHHTEDRAGDAPKPPFPTKFIKTQQTPKIKPPVNHKNYPLFLSLCYSKPRLAVAAGLGHLAVVPAAHSRMPSTQTRRCEPPQKEMLHYSRLRNRILCIAISRALLI